ncbi:hypothetical protein JL09_g6149 [Pichia kudriavzevii]|uniref:Uncharacterized protein n=1 Tax=Pichia kudriavzevii TaxID=4909 RepID=A0A099NRY6_PICKU|nr:hypothetical protein JL09_g6149 [Pichia kudriavzevii]
MSKEGTIEETIGLQFVENNGTAKPLNNPRNPSFSIVALRQFKAVGYVWICILVFMESNGNPQVVDIIDEA